jgi:hypothetical protein
MRLLQRQPTLHRAHWLPIPYTLPWWSNRELSEIAGDVSAHIENFYISNPTVSGIILCGFSLGAMLARRAYLDAHGYGTPPGQTRRWAHAVERIVLLGAICRGFNRRRLPPHHRLVLQASRLFGRAKALRSAFWGQPFASNVRVDWITLRQRSTARPLVVNVLGTHDPLVTREDAIDLEQDPDAAHVDIPGATHDTVIFPTPTNQALLVEAFVGNPPLTSPPPMPERYKPFTNVTNVYMLLHGMRSSKHYVTELAQALDRPDSLVLTPDYGYISIYSFLSRAYRRSSAAHFVDDFTQCFALHPRARFSFAGHSNGTCILGEVLQAIPRIQFARLYLAGSALPSTAWQKKVLFLY